MSNSTLPSQILESGSSAAATDPDQEFNTEEHFQILDEGTPSEEKRVGSNDQTQESAGKTPESTSWKAQLIIYDLVQGVNTQSDSKNEEKK